MCAVLPAIAIRLGTGNILLFLSLLLLAAILISQISARYGVPGMLLFLIIGMVAGPDGLGIEIANHKMAEFFGHLGITIIILTGGLETSLKTTRPVMMRGFLLSTVGLAVTVLSTGFFIFHVFGDRIGSAGATLLSCFLIASVLSSTDAPSLFTVLRSKRLTLRENLNQLLELESGSNDPTAYTLTLILVEIMTESDLFGLKGGSWFVGATVVILTLAWHIVSGVGVGLAVGYAARWLIRRIKLRGAPFFSILILTLAMLANGLTTVIGGNGLFALYVTAVMIANTPDLPFRKDVSKFYESITWLAQLLMFLLLGLLARPSYMSALLGPALLIGLFLMFVGRPLGVFISLLPFRKPSLRARLGVAWAGMKGAGPILFALCTVVAGVEGSQEIFNIVFVIALLSLLVQGTTLVPVARKLDLCIEDDPEVETFGMEVPEEMGLLRDHVVTRNDLARGTTLRDLRLPHGIRVLMVGRDGKFIVPHGSLELKEGDRLVIILGNTED